MIEGAGARAAQRYHRDATRQPFGGQGIMTGQVISRVEVLGEAQWERCARARNPRSSGMSAS